MKKGQSPTEAAKKLTKEYIKETVRIAIAPIHEDVKNYITKLVGSELPDEAQKVLMMDVIDIIELVLDFVEVYVTFSGFNIEINIDQVADLIESITSMVNHNPEYIKITNDYFREIEIDTTAIQEIVNNRIKQSLVGSLI